MMQKKDNTSYPNGITTRMPVGLVFERLTQKNNPYYGVSWYRKRLVMKLTLVFDKAHEIIK